jgi:phytoene synthase
MTESSDLHKHRGEAAAHCQRILQKGSKSFYAASRLLPARIRGDIAVVYAYCREADDLVDDQEAGRTPLGADGVHCGPNAGPRQTEATVEKITERLHAGLDRVYGATKPISLVERAFAQVVERHAIPRAVVAALFEGFFWDLEGRSYETIAEVRAYGVRVAATVGLMATLVMGERRRAVLARACDLGVAMQLTNIARDVGEDARRGRLYLPRQWLRDERVDIASWLRNPVFTPAVGVAIRRLLEEAHRLYVRAESGIAQLPRDCQPAIWAARYIYADIGRVIEKRHFDTVSMRAHTSVIRKLQWLLWACGQTFLRGIRTVGTLNYAVLEEAVYLLDAVAARTARSDTGTNSGANAQTF